MNKSQLTLTAADWALLEYFRPYSNGCVIRGKIGMTQIWAIAILVNE